MAISNRIKKVSVFGLLLGAFVTSASAQSPGCKSQAESVCSQRCGDSGECIFGCEIGQFTSLEQCTFDCNGLGPACVASCVNVVQAVECNCTAPVDVTSQVTVKAGAIVYNRSTQLWQQTIVLTNAGSSTLSNLVYVLDSLNAGWTLINGDGMTLSDPPIGSSYKNISVSVAPEGQTTITLQFSRTGTPAFGYTTRVISGPDLYL